MRSRLRPTLLALGTMALGLGVHFHGSHLSSGLRDKLGDALWAAMIAFGFAGLAPRWSAHVVGLAAIGTCVAVEVSQRWRAPWLEALRGTTLGRLTLGSGYDAADLVAYAAGVVFAVLALRRVL